MPLSKYIKRVFRYVINGEPVKNIKAEISYLHPNGRLVGKKIIVTGGGRGLGASMAEKFVDEGADVLIAGRNEKSLKDTAGRIGCNYLILDVSKVECFDDFINEADKILGGVNCLVNNAGISLHEASFFDVTPETFDSQTATNFKGPFFLTQAFIRKVKTDNRKANIIFMSSETGDTSDFRPYGLTKAAVNSMTQGLAHLFAKDNIRINAVAPGVTASDMTGISPNDNLYLSYNHTERAYLPDEVAEIACFLISDASACISGQIITCNNANTVNARWR